MYHVDNSTGVPVMPLPSPITSETELFFTEGGNGVPPTYPGPDWFNAIQSELLNIIRAAGLDPDKMDNTQILAALKKLFLSRSNPFGDIKTDGAAAIATALSNLGLGDVVHLSQWTSGGTPTGRWRRTPDGVIEQWGTVDVLDNQVVTVNFPVAFPTAVEAINITPITDGPNSNTDVVSGYGKPIGTTQMRVGLCSNYSSGATSVYYNVKGR
ncbi:hypothetical protein [Klebsiella sp. WP3-S18-ESBL-05]|uniref:gp53-like domain-containing protein n=1 Tax=Klebsiella sp. WP3-S18-ESBL-05 TaxID=2675711 RepID=UPI0015DD2050|nr:hypothetical protein [Klebsiella sp. WP3-S18-ESBL-05]BBR21454.1 hypothetical protein WP3S18E05_29340 [Klebsiella sp. WP3-S18-ESBL-05]